MVRYRTFQLRAAPRVEALPATVAEAVPVAALVHLEENKNLPKNPSLVPKKNDYSMQQKTTSLDQNYGTHATAKKLATSAARNARGRCKHLPRRELEADGARERRHRPAEPGVIVFR